MPKTLTVAKETFVPLYDRVLIRRDNSRDMVGGFYIPDTAQDKPQRGTVLAVGRGKIDKGTLVGLSVARGDTVLFSKYAGGEITIDGEELLVVKEEEILGIVKPAGD